MQKSIASFTAALMLAVAGAAFAAAASDAKEVTLPGTMKCAKCSMHVSKTCADVLEVKEGDKTTDYYIAKNDTSKGVHKNICTEDKDNVTVTGTVSEKDGQKILTATKIEGL
jgi:type 1 fimbria pilin